MLFSLFHFCQYTLNSSLSLNRHLCADDTLPFFSFLPTNFDSSITYYKMLFNRPSPGRLQIFQHLTPLKLNPCSSNSKSNYTKYITPHCTQPILLATLASSLMNTSPLQTKMSSLSKSRYYYIHQLRCIRPYLDSTTASTMHCHLQSFIVHSELDYCNSVYYNLPKSETTRLKQIQNSLSRAVVKAPNICLPLYSCTALKENMCNFPVAVYEIITLVDHMLLVSIYDTKSNKPNALEWEARAQQLLRWTTVWPQ